MGYSLVTRAPFKASQLSNKEVTPSPFFNKKVFSQLCPSRQLLTSWYPLYRLPPQEVGIERGLG